MQFENLEHGRKYYACRLDNSRSPAEPVIETLVYLGYFETDTNSSDCERPYHFYQFSHYGQDFPCISVPSRKQLEMNYYESVHDLQVELNRFRTPWGKIERNDTVVLIDDHPESGLRSGDVGTVMFVHTPDTAYETDFVDGDGRCLASLKLMAGEVRKWQAHELLRVRQHGN